MGAEAREGVEADASDTFETIDLLGCAGGEHIIAELFRVMR